MLFTAFIWQKSICLFISIPYPNQYDQQRKIFLSGDLCVVLCHAPKYLFSQDGIFQQSVGCTKKNYWLYYIGFSWTHMKKHVSSFSCSVFGWCQWKILYFSWENVYWILNRCFWFLLQSDPTTFTYHVKTFRNQASFY